MLGTKPKNIFLDDIILPINDWQTILSNTFKEFENLMQYEQINTYTYILNEDTIKNRENNQFFQTKGIRFLEISFYIYCLLVQKHTQNLKILQFQEEKKKKLASQPRKKKNDDCFLKWGQLYFQQFEFEVNLKYQEMLHNIREFQKKYPKIKQVDGENYSNSPPQKKPYFSRSITPVQNRRENNFASIEKQQSYGSLEQNKQSSLTPDKQDNNQISKKKNFSQLKNYFSPTKHKNLSDQQLQNLQIYNDDLKKLKKNLFEQTFQKKKKSHQLEQVLKYFGQLLEKQETLIQKLKNSQDQEPLDKSQLENLMKELSVYEKKLQVMGLRQESFSQLVETVGKKEFQEKKNLLRIKSKDPKINSYLSEILNKRLPKKDQLTKAITVYLWDKTQIKCRKQKWRNQTLSIVKTISSYQKSYQAILLKTILKQLTQMNSSSNQKRLSQKENFNPMIGDYLNSPKMILQLY
eukprot:TRINITY_DN1963_c0_g1_i9.p1 TRINITY_DN1963_c0_g1~~TRINITY_DN1963_c0_g1_i9.p1  ORF type:complete len:464 (-),score=67.47 TRINITY_DN1963_c0_g1_i9:351-1742(-)